MAHEDGEEAKPSQSVRPHTVQLPKKGMYRQRAHCNPLSDTNIEYPLSPDFVDWSVHYPIFFSKQEDLTLQLNTSEYPISYKSLTDSALNGRCGPAPEFLDVGCGYGGLLVALAKRYPKTLIMGMEIREKITNFVGQRIRALRVKHKEENWYSNIAVIRTNVMKFLVNYFRKGQLKKLFFCFPDPHFKRSNWKRRIISASMLSLYAFVLRPDGLIYAATDVYELFIWMREACAKHPLFEEVLAADLVCATSPVCNEEGDICATIITTETEESKKVLRNGLLCYSCVFKRLPDPVAISLPLAITAQEP